MKLINADKLEVHEQLSPLGNGMYESTFIVYKDDIDKQPTVDAIPVDFIKKKIDKYRKKEDQAKDEPLSGYFKWVSTSKRRSLEWLLLDWKAEQDIVDVPVIHGKWLPKHHYIAGYEFASGHICSECGNDALNAEGDDFLTDFCPNCGAKMDGEIDE